MDFIQWIFMKFKFLADYLQGRVTTPWITLRFICQFVAEFWSYSYLLLLEFGQGTHQDVIYDLVLFVQHEKLLTKAVLFALFLSTFVIFFLCASKGKSRPFEQRSFIVILTMNSGPYLFTSGKYRTNLLN